MMVNRLLFKKSYWKWLLCLVFFNGLLSSCIAQKHEGTIVKSYRGLVNAKTKADEGESAFVRNRDRILKEANQILISNETFSVTYKTNVPPSGDKHDFLSLPPYWWPDTNTQDGLPYIQKDGEVNPESESIPDKAMLDKISRGVFVLGHAYFYTGDEKYVTKAKQLIDVFFVSPDTRMNPNFEYSQIIRGHPTSGGATIGAHPFIDLIDGVQLIKPSDLWSDQDHSALQGWFSEFLDWFLNSKKGKAQAKQKNNIGTYYTLQAVTYAIFSDDISLAKKLYESRAFSHISDQINSDGSMPLELSRKNHAMYVRFNLSAFRKLEEIGRIMGIDLRNYEAPTGGSIQKAETWFNSNSN